MPVPLIAPLATVITGALGVVVTKVFEFFYHFLGYKVAKMLAVGTASVVAAGLLTATMAATIKQLVLLARVAMPPSMSAFTYFLPSNINVVLASIITVRMTHFIWQWSMKNLGRYTQSVH